MRCIVCLVWIILINYAYSSNVRRIDKNSTKSLILFTDDNLPFLDLSRSKTTIKESKQQFTHRLRERVMIQRLLGQYGFNGVGKTIRSHKPLVGKCGFIKGTETHVFVVNEHVHWHSAHFKPKEYEVIMIGAKHTPIHELRKAMIMSEIDVSAISINMWHDPQTMRNRNLY
eukprot:63893_1